MLSPLNGQVFSNQIGVYNPIPDSASITSDHYIVEVSDTATGPWRNVQVLQTKAILSDTYSSANGAGYENYKRYYENIWGCTHSYANFVVNGNFHVRVSKKSGATLSAATKAYPADKVINAALQPGNLYFQFEMKQAANIAIDIDGITAAFANPNNTSSSPTSHALSIHANPVLDGIPSTTAANVLNIPSTGGQVLADLKAAIGVPPSGKTIVYFGPGIHNLGSDFKIRAGITYYIPGDAYINGTFNNHLTNYIGGSQWEQRPLDSYVDANNKTVYHGDNITIFGHGTISGKDYEHWTLSKIDRYQRPPTDPNFENFTVTAANKSTLLPNNPKFTNDTENQRNSYKRKAISIIEGHKAKIIGVNIVDPGNHSLYVTTKVNTALSDPTYRNHVSWVKVFAWRVNSDGGGHQQIGTNYNCFYRVQDDGYYPKGFMLSNNVVWSDSNGTSLRLSAINEILLPRMRVDKIDALFRKNMSWSNSTVIGTTNPDDLPPVWNGPLTDGYNSNFDKSTKQVTFSNITISDPNPHKPVISLQAQAGTKLGKLVFENITIASALPKNVIRARKASEESYQGVTAVSKGLSDGVIYDITFRNVRIGGQLVTNANWDQYFTIMHGNTALTKAQWEGTNQAHQSFLYNINFGDGSVTTPVSAPLSRTNWAVTSNPTGSGHNNIKDNSLTSRWTTNAAQTSGQHLQLDLGAITEFNRIEFDHTNNHFDYMRGYEIRVSNSGTDWATAPLIAASSINSLNGKFSISFTNQTAQYIRITQTGSAGNSTGISAKWWSISELNLFKDL